jgi:hypothetical protein
MGIVQQYVKSGGLAGQAHKVLQAELEKAKTDKQHVLRAVAELFKRNKQEEAIILLVKILAQQDADSPLAAPAVIFSKVPLTREMISYTEKNFDYPELLEDIPVKIIQWAGIGIGLHESKAAGGRKKGKKWQEAVIKAWEASDKKETVPSFAIHFFRTNGGQYGDDGDKEGKIPSPRTIEKYVRAHKKKK